MQLKPPIPRCFVCGMESEETTLVVGRLMCPPCVSGREPPVVMPPSAREAEQIREWLKPRTTVHTDGKRGSNHV